MQAIAPRTLSGSLLTDPQTGFGHYQTVRADDLTARHRLSACVNGYFTVVEEGASQDRYSNRETPCDRLLQAPEVQTSLVVTEGLDDEFRDFGSHPDVGFARLANM